MIGNWLTCVGCSIDKICLGLFALVDLLQLLVYVGFELLVCHYLNSVGLSLGCLFVFCISYMFRWFRL